MSRKTGPWLVVVIVLAAMALVSGVVVVGCCGGLWIWALRAQRAQQQPLAQILDPSIPLHEELNVEYGTGAGEPLRLDLYAPKSLEQPTAAIVCIHGGGWYSGSKESFGDLAKYFAQHGYVAVTVQYRFAPKHRFPAQVEDVQCAVRWLRANAERYHIDPARIGAIGGSAGGHLALMLGLLNPADGMQGDGGNGDQPSKVQAVVNFFGPVDLARDEWPPVTEKMLVEFLAGKRSEIPDRYVAASPIHYIDAGDPPVLTFHGTKDPLVPYHQAELLHEALQAAGVFSQLESRPGQGHDFGTDFRERLKLSLEFFDKQIGNK